MSTPAVFGGYFHMNAFNFAAQYFFSYYYFFTQKK